MKFDENIAEKTGEAKHRIFVETRNLIGDELPGSSISSVASPFLSSGMRFCSTTAKDCAISTCLS